MTRATQALLKQAVRLPERERAYLAHALLASLDGQPDADWTQAWADELARRIAEIDSGTVELRDWGEVHDRIAATLSRK